ncbi:MAG: hypothetical protein JWR62_2162, partial [Modestobacter sp.]|nr:hypothetical protein [Modestobacter sp.]
MLPDSGADAPVTDEHVVEELQECQLSTVSDVLRMEGVRSLFQPIIAIDTGRVVAYEALARGPEGPLHAPDALFAAAREAGLLAELDAACRA